MMWIIFQFGRARFAAIKVPMNEAALIRCGMYIAPKKRPKFGYDDFISVAKQHGVVVVDLDLDGDHDNLPGDLDVILHKVCFGLNIRASSASLQQRFLARKGLHFRYELFADDR